MEYMITKEQSQKKIDKRQNVCTNCGGELTPFETVDNADQPTHWAGCKSCLIYTNGIKEHIYKIAARMVDDRNFTTYHFEQRPDKEKEPEKFDRWRKSQIGGTVYIVSDILQLEKEVGK